AEMICYDSAGQYAYTLSYRYDERERMIWSQDAMGHVQEYAYDANDNLRHTYGPRAGMHREIFYDRAGRPIKSVNGALTVETEYDVLGRVIAEIDSSGYKTSFFYDRMGNLVTTLYADGRRWDREYNVLGHMI